MIQSKIFVQLVKITRKHSFYSNHSNLKEINKIPSKSQRVTKNDLSVEKINFAYRRLESEETEIPLFLITKIKTLIDCIFFIRLNLCLIKSCVS